MVPRGTISFKKVFVWGEGSINWSLSVCSLPRYLRIALMDFLEIFRKVQSYANAWHHFSVRFWAKNEPKMFWGVYGTKNSKTNKLNWWRQGVLSQPNLYVLFCQYNLVISLRCLSPPPPMCKFSRKKLHPRNTCIMPYYISYYIFWVQ